MKSVEHVALIDEESNLSKRVHEGNKVHLKKRKKYCDRCEDIRQRQIDKAGDYQGLRLELAAVDAH